MPSYVSISLFVFFQEMRQTKSTNISPYGGLSLDHLKLYFNSSICVGS